MVKNEDFCQIVSSVHNSSRREAGTSIVKASVSTKIPRQIMEVEGGVSWEKNLNQVVEIIDRVAKTPD